VTTTDFQVQEILAISNALFRFSATETTESDSSSVPTKNSLPFLSLKESRTMTVIEIRPHHNGRKVFEAPGVEPVLPEKNQAINYAENRASFRSGEIRILNSIGHVERTILFTEADRRL